jgi:hypothetical protein
MGSVGARLRGALPLSLCVCAVILAGCKVPAAPEWEVGLSVPLSSDPITTVDLLPSEVDTATVSGVPVFVLQDQADSVDYTLGAMCPACGVLQGLTTTVPTFDYQDSIDVAFDLDLVSVEVLSANLGLFVFNQLNFDPLRPGAGGYIALAARDLGTGALLDSVFVDGASQTLPAGQRTQFDLNISNSTLTQGFRVVINVHSPSDGQTVTIDNNLGARFGAVLSQIRIGALTAVIDAETLDEEFVIEFDQDARSDIAENLVSAQFEFEMNHNLEIAGGLESSIAGSSADLFSGDPSREVRLVGLTFESGEKQSGVLTVQDMEQIAAFPQVHIGYRGSVSGSGAGNTSRFTPAQYFETKLTFTTFVRVNF